MKRYHTLLIIDNDWVIACLDEYLIRKYDRLFINGFADKS